jgi:hypothetical protein
MAALPQAAPPFMACERADTPLRWRDVPREDSALAPLPYSIDCCSGYSADYEPARILCDRPSDQSSRWSSASNNSQQFVQLRLERPAIVQRIYFGKFHKMHVCNLKEFRVLAGLRRDALQEVLHSGTDTAASCC